MTPRHLILDFVPHRLQGLRPFATFEARGNAWTWHSQWPHFPFHDGSGDALHEIQRALQWSHEHVNHGRSTPGAAIGFIAYDAARQWEPRAFATQSPRDDLQLPDIRLTFCESLQVETLSRSTPGAPDTLYSLAEVPPPASPDYFAALHQIQEYIAAGDIYQANYTQRFQAPLPYPPALFYERLRALHPMPFAALLGWDDLSVVSNSPERFLRLQDRQLLAQPIKGTMRRSDNVEEDAQLRQVLHNSVKDRAEHVMIVDLLRNDLGRVCEYGSVRVPELFEVQSFPTLHHLVSTVTGTLRAELSAVDAFRAAFPCGSITGAPKIRAMQIIDELEPVRRGVAMGAIGYFGFNGDMDWNIAIRTVTCIRNSDSSSAYFHAGGGIVADSEPQSEFDEMRLKASALWYVLHS